MKREGQQGCRLGLGLGLDLTLRLGVVAVPGTMLVSSQESRESRESHNSESCFPGNLQIPEFRYKLLAVYQL